MALQIRGQFDPVRQPWPNCWHACSAIAEANQDVSDCTTAENWVECLRRAARVRTRAQFTLLIAAQTSPSGLVV